MDYMEVPAFYTLVRTNQAVSKLALAFIILTGTRSKETRQAQWSEIDFKDKQWNIPAEKMKIKRSHVVPLSQQSLEICILLTE